MKQVKAIIQPHMTNKVLQALHQLKHFPGLTIFEVSGQGRGEGPQGGYQPDIEGIFEHKRRLIEIVCSDDDATEIADTIRAAAHTGRRGDGIIVITEISQVIRIRSGETRENAV